VAERHQRFNELQKVAVEESPSGIPLLFALDVIHGYRTIFPVPLPWLLPGIHRWQSALRRWQPMKPAPQASLDLWPHARYRPRCPLGPHR
jgi:hypothetical protein